jgi:hypothetical protein
MEYVDEHKVSLNDITNRWMPEVARGQQGHAQDAGQPDLGLSRLRDRPGLDRGFNANPFHLFTYKERLGYAFARPVQFAPGKN